jgi:hypothetical protein
MAHAARNHHKLKGGGGGVTEHWLQRHLGSADIDTLSPTCNRALWRAFRDAALTGTDAEMDDAGADAFGTWYATHLRGGR